MALERAKLRASEVHSNQGRRLAAVGKYQEALVEYRMASQLNPTSEGITEELRDVTQKIQTVVESRNDGRTELEALIDRARELGPSDLNLLTNIKLPDSMVFRNASSRDIFSVLGRLSNISVIFDPDFQDRLLSVELRETSFDDIFIALLAATRNFYRITAPKTITIIPDTPTKRGDYEEEVVQTFYLSNADLTETIELLRLVMDIRSIAPMNSTRAISIKDTPDRIAAAGKLIRAIDKARPEVIIAVELLEVNRVTLTEYGLQFASPGSPGIAGQLNLARPDFSIDDLTNLTTADVLVANLPSLFYRLLKSDANTRVLANPRLRTSEGIPAQARFGERIPVPVSTFVPIAAEGVAQQPIASFTYEPIGVNIDITPHTHHDDDVSVSLQVEISNISGTGFGDLPTFGSRLINTTIRLRDGETNILAGLIRDDERDTLSGIPGLSKLPLIGRLFARNSRQTQETDIILTLTPHIVRVLDLAEEDLRPFEVGPSNSSQISLPFSISPLESEPVNPGSTPSIPITPIFPPTE